MHAICRELGVPLADEKWSPPSTRLEILGVRIDTTAMTIALPDRKLADLRETLGVLQGRQKCTQRELLSLVGRLVHASKCVPPGRAFTRRLLDAAHSVSGLNHRMRITARCAGGHEVVGDVSAAAEWDVSPCAAPGGGQGQESGPLLHYF